MVCNCLAFAAEVLGPDRSLVEQRPDQATSDIANHGLRLEHISQAEGLEANAGVDHELRKEVDPGDLHVEPGSRQVALGLADIGSVLKQLRGHSYVQRVNGQIVESRRHAFDRLRVAIKTDGKAVPDIKKHGQENVFPRFETFRENIEGHFWFPTYTHSEDTLQFSTGSVRIRMTVRYENYKRFGSTIKIGQPIEIPKEKP